MLGNEAGRTDHRRPEAERVTGADGRGKKVEEAHVTGTICSKPRSIDRHEAQSRLMHCAHRQHCSITPGRLLFVSKTFPPHARCSFGY